LSNLLKFLEKVIIHLLNFGASYGLHNLTIDRRLISQVTVLRNIQKQ